MCQLKTSSEYKDNNYNITSRAELSKGDSVIKTLKDMSIIVNDSIKARVYYGEYTLRHWLNLMLTRNIDLPEYQRSFVWDEDDVRRLIDSLQSGQFVLPVTIAHYKNGADCRNLILDGQQRLTSLLLAFVGYMPKKEMFNNSEDNIAHGDDSREEGDEGVILEWTYKNILRKDPQENSVDKIRERLRGDERYRELNLFVEEDIEEFYDKTFLGFSFIIPNGEDAKETQRYFSMLFRNMNYLGKKLSSLESRRSLYFMNADYKDYFDGRLENGDDVLCGIRIVENMVPRKIDFVRYLSMLSQYTVVKNNDIWRVMVGYSAYSWRESYYADYVAYVVNLEQVSRKDKFDGFDMEQTFPNQIWKERFKEVKAFLERNKGRLGLDEKNDAFTSWIDADYWLFGLLYHVLFLGKNLVREQELVDEVKREIYSKRHVKDNGVPTEYQRNPNRIGNLRERITRSLEIFNSYAE